MVPTINDALSFSSSTTRPASRGYFKNIAFLELISENSINIEDHVILLDVISGRHIIIIVRGHQEANFPKGFVTKIQCVAFFIRDCVESVPFLPAFFR